MDLPQELSWITVGRIHGPNLRHMNRYSPSMIVRRTTTDSSRYAGAQYSRNMICAIRKKSAHNMIDDYIYYSPKRWCRYMQVQGNCVWMFLFKSIQTFVHEHPPRGTGRRLDELVAMVLHAQDPPEAHLACTSTTPNGACSVLPLLLVSLP